MKNIQKLLIYLFIIVSSLHATPNEDLMKAIDEDNLSTLEKSLAINTANLEDQIDCDNNTLLLYAIKQSKLDAALLLIKAGANVNAIDNEKNSALIQAFSDMPHCTILIDALVSAGAHINYCGKNNWNPMIMAARCQNAIMYCCWLIKHGADCNIADSDNNKAQNHLSQNVIATLIGTSRYRSKCNIKYIGRTLIKKSNADRQELENRLIQILNHPTNITNVSFIDQHAAEMDSRINDEKLDHATFHAQSTLKYIKNRYQYIRNRELGIKSLTYSKF